MLQIRVNENGMVLAERETLSEARTVLERFLAEDRANGEDVEEGYYEIYDTNTEEQIEVNEARFIER